MKYVIFLVIGFTLGLFFDRASYYIHFSRELRRLRAGYERRKALRARIAPTR